MALTMTFLSGTSPLGVVASGGTLTVTPGTTITYTATTTGFTGSFELDTTTSIVPGSPGVGTTPPTLVDYFSNPTGTISLPIPSGFSGSTSLIFEAKFVTGGPFTNSYTITAGVTPPPTTFDFELVVPPAVFTNVPVTADVSTSPTATDQGFVITRIFDPGDGNTIDYTGVTGVTDSSGEASEEFNSVNAGVITYSVSSNNFEIVAGVDSADQTVYQPRLTIDGESVKYSFGNEGEVTTIDESVFEGGATIAGGLFGGVVVDPGLDTTGDLEIFQNASLLASKPVTVTDGVFSVTLDPVTPECGPVQIKLTLIGITGTATQQIVIKPDAAEQVGPATFEGSNIFVNLKYVGDV